jgi:antitoxin ParD1/3/4
MTTNVDLTLELERFARDCVQSGRYDTVSDVMRSALRLLQEREERRKAFNEMLRDVEADADRHGAVDIAVAMAEMDEAIARS